jgi:prepilin-type N-terminal cleavage/methylation domain-containing protein
VRDKKSSGYSLIELLMVILILNILAAIALATYVGIRDKTRRAFLIRSASSAVPEVRLWLRSSVSPNKDIRSVDTNFSGNVEMTDKKNEELLSNVAATYVDGRNSVGDMSPFFSLPLWSSALPVSNGRITLVQVDASQVTMTAAGKTGHILYERIIFPE